MHRRIPCFILCLRWSFKLKCSVIDSWAFSRKVLYIYGKPRSVWRGLWMPILWLAFGLVSQSQQPFKNPSGSVMVQRLKWAPWNFMWEPTLIAYYHLDEPEYFTLAIWDLIPHARNPSVDRYHIWKKLRKLHGTDGWWAGILQSIYLVNAHMLPSMIMRPLLLTHRNGSTMMDVFKWRLVQILGMCSLLTLLNHKHSFILITSRYTDSELLFFFSFFFFFFCRCMKNWSMVDISATQFILISRFIFRDIIVTNLCFCVFQNETGRWTFFLKCADGVCGWPAITELSSASQIGWGWLPCLVCSDPLTFHICLIPLGWLDSTGTSSKYLLVIPPALMGSGDWIDPRNMFLCLFLVAYPEWPILWENQ